VEKLKSNKQKNPNKPQHISWIKCHKVPVSSSNKTPTNHLDYYKQQYYHLKLAQQFLKNFLIISQNFNNLLGNQKTKQQTCATSQNKCESVTNKQKIKIHKK